MTDPSGSVETLEDGDQVIRIVGDVDARRRIDLVGKSSDQAAELVVESAGRRWGLVASLHPKDVIGTLPGN